jgi:carbon starvation protein
VAAAGPARLPLDLPEDRHDLVLAIGILVRRADLQMPALTKFIDGTGPVWAGSAVPLPVHHHRLRRRVRLPRADLSGTTPKLLENESHARFIGYGGMLMESFVAIMALVAASHHRPGRLFRHEQPRRVIGRPPWTGSPGDPGWGFVVTPDVLTQTAPRMSARTPSSRVPAARRRWPSAWRTSFQCYRLLGDDGLLVPLRHPVRSAVHPDAVDAGTRVARFMWGSILVMGVNDPAGWDQHAVSALRHRQPAARGDRL